MLLHVTMQQISAEPSGGIQALELDEVRIEAEDYDSALTQAEGRVPAGWRMIALRVDRVPDRGVRS